MKNTIAICVLLALMLLPGCRTMGTTQSRRGGVTPTNEEFSITVPKFNSIKQGAEMAVTVSLNRGAYFKRDVQLELQADGISVTPNQLLVKASDTPDAKFQIAVPTDAAIGEYRVTVKATPTTGASTSTEFTIKVLAAQ